VIGSALGPYVVLSKLGEGGMGVVYRARDTRLGREVAVKVLPPALTREPGPSSAAQGPATDSKGERLARFEREARAIASLAHPHICTLYDVGRQDGVDFLVMELVRGETLAERLRRGPLPIDEILACAVQVADALDSAHRQGIIHRDLKPGNIMLTAEGAKLLDFGLARLLPSPDALADGVTIPPLTTEGSIPGTVPYMAPEQLEGHAPDRRTDLFALGAIVYEMACGRRPFDGSSQAALIGAILHSTPAPLASLRPDVPPALARVVTICLAKDPGHRWSSAHDVVLLLEGIRSEQSGAVGSAARGAEAQAATLPAVPRPPRSMRERAAWTLAGLAVLAAVFFALAGRTGPGLPLDILSVVPPAGTALTVGNAPQISPDGRTVAFVATDANGRTMLYLRARDSLVTRALEGTDDAALPFWSPDGTRLGFFARGSLRTVAVEGGRVQVLAPATVPRGGAWSRDDVIVFVPYPNDVPRRIPAAGGDATPVPVRQPFEERRWFPSFLPDGRHYLYLSVDAQRRIGVRVRVASLDSDQVVDLMPSASPGVYVEPGYVLFRRDRALMAQRFDHKSLALEGTPGVVVENVGFNPLGYQGFFSASERAVLAYLEPDAGWDLAWFDRLGRPLGRAGEPGQYNSLCLSPDGRRVVYDRADDSGNMDLWSLDLETGVPTRLTFDPGVDFYPVCSPRSDATVFSSLRLGMPSLFHQPVAAPGGETRLTSPNLPTFATDWSRDGKRLLYSESNPKTNWDIWVLPLDGGKPTPFATTEAQERNARFSPDGRWIAYTLQEGGATEVYVQPYPPTGARWQVSAGGGRQPAWSPDGTELYYLTSEDKLMAVEVSRRSGALVPGRSRVVAETRVAGVERTNQGSSFAVSPDGERLLVVSAGNRVRPITLVLNWTSLLR
jgi:Tol biopolymer transport system component